MPQDDTVGVSVFFLMTDIEGSTRLWESHEAQMARALQWHDQIAREIIEANGGSLVKDRGEGDSLFAVFDTPDSAIASAIELNRRLIGKSFDSFELAVRSAIHGGQALSRDGDFYGPIVNRCARIRASGHGGQILMSQSAQAKAANTIESISLGLHRLKDLERPEEIFQVCADGLPREFPPLNTLEAGLHNLPSQTTSFIGRSEDLAKVGNLLSAHRLVTLLGSGGVGKSRLAVQVGAELVDQFPKGVWLVEMTTSTSQEAVIADLYRAMGMANMGGSQPLLDRLREGSALLILDNCESLLDETRHLANQLLNGAPKLRILATSREPLGSYGETTFRVPSLAVPEEWTAEISELMASDAVRLFEQRARAANSAFLLGIRNVKTVAAICRRLDGVPFAIELAASKTRILSVEQIESKLEDRFRLLAGRSSGLNRNQTLKEILDWSYEQLEPETQRFFSRLGVFPALFTWSAATWIAGEGEDEYGVLALLEELADKSLLQVVDRGDTHAYALLETVRSYTRSLLTERDLEKLKTAHFDFYFKQAIDREDKFILDQANWVRSHDLDRDNYEAAFSYGQAAAVPREKLREFAGSLFRFWYMTGDIAGSRLRFESLLDARDERSDGTAKCLSGAGVNAWRQKDFARAEDLHRRAAEVRRELKDEVGEANALSNLGLVYLDQDRVEKAVEAFQISLDIRAHHGDDFGVGNALNNLGIAAWKQGRLEDAVGYYERSLETRKQLGDLAGEGDVLLNLALIQRDLGRYEEAGAQAEQALAVCESSGNTRSKVDILHNLAMIQLLQHDVSASRSSLAKAREIARRLSSEEQVAWADFFEASCDLEDGNLIAAERRFLDSADHQLIGKRCRASATAGLAAVAYQRGLVEEAIAGFVKADAESTASNIPLLFMPPVAAIRAQIPSAFGEAPSQK